MTDSPRSSLTLRLGLRVPIVQAPIGSAASPELAAAVARWEAAGAPPVASMAEEARTALRTAAEQPW